MPLLAGTPSPIFSARTHARPNFSFGSMGGMFVLLAFLPEDARARDQVHEIVRARRALFDDRNRAIFGVVRDAAHFGTLKIQLPGVRYFLDEDGSIAEAFHLIQADGGTMGQWVLLDPSMRVIFSAPLEEHGEAFAMIASFTDPDTHAGVALNAPVLIVPRVFEPDFCRRLIGEYERDGGSASGVMREVDGMTVPILDDFKKRRDAMIEDEALKGQIRTRITARLLPEVRKSLMFTVTRMERYIVARYGADDGGYFRPHRDNTTKGTAHRQFACSINLNAEDFEGGDLRFPEFGRRTYRPPTGGAVIFSCSLLHEATRVTRGNRFAFLPFFYNEDGAKIRDANRRFLGPAEPATKVIEATGA